MKLRFYAKDDGLAYDPRYPKVTGQPPRYIGRKWDPKTHGHPATETPCDFDDDNSEATNRAIKLCRRGDVWPADEATARRCGIAFVRTAFKDGAHVAAPATVTASKKGSAE